MAHANNWHTLLEGTFVIINIKPDECDEPILCVDPDDMVSTKDWTQFLMSKEKAKSVQGKLSRQWPQCEYVIYELVKVNADKL